MRQHGIEHRLPMNQTPLMAAAAAGNVALVEALLERGADSKASTSMAATRCTGRCAKRSATRRSPAGLRRALRAACPGQHRREHRRPARAHRPRHSEYFLFQTLWTLFKSRFTHDLRHARAAFETKPSSTPGCTCRPTWCGPSANRPAPLRRAGPQRGRPRLRLQPRLFKRVAQGWYQFNPALAVRHGDDGAWTPIFQALNLPFVAEFTPSEFGWNGVRLSLQSYLKEAGMLEVSLPIAEERMQGESRIGVAQRGA